MKRHRKKNYFDNEEKNHIQGMKENVFDNKEQNYIQELLKLGLEIDYVGYEC